MFSGRSPVAVCAALAILWAAPLSYAQQNLSWDANGASAGTGGSGTWNTSAAIWSDGTTLRAWNNSLLDNAIFGGTAGTVALGVPTTVQNATFSVGGYTLTGGTLTLAGLVPALSLTTGATTIASAITGAAGLTTTGAGSLTLSGVGSYSGGLTVNGSGTLSLTNSANSYTGGTTIQSGTLQIGAGGPTGNLGTSSHVVNNGTFGINRTGTVTVGQVISGTGNLSKLATGTAILSGDNTYTGTTSISDGILQIGVGGTVGTLGTGNVAVTGALSRLQINRSDTITLGQNISGTGNLTQAGTGTTILTGTNTYSTTTISAGRLQLGAGGPSGSLSAGGVTVAANSTFALNRSGTLTLSNLIAGAGTLSQAGPGTTILLGKNTYSGGTTISAGTLQIGNGGTAGQIGSGAVTNNGTLMFNRNHSESDGRTIANVISGTGSLVQDGIGTIWLTGTNTYTGPTIINRGTLSLGGGLPLLVPNGGATGDLGASSQVVNAGTLEINRSTAITLGQAISGGGQLTKLGTGVATLTGNSTFTGLTTISRGTLQLGDGGGTGMLGSGSVLVNAGALLAFNRDNTYVVNNAITGAGDLTKMGTGTTILTGANTYTGATTISGGTLQLGNGGTTGSIAGNIINNANVSFDRSNALTYGNVISGTGTLAKTGAGTLTLTGANSYTGDTTVTGGALRIGNGGTTGSIAGNIVNNANVSFDRSNALTYGNVISGTGTLAKTGAGTLTLTGANSYTGDTTVTGGALRIGNGGTTGSIAGNIINNANVSFDRSNALTYGNVISGTGTLTKTGAGTLTLTGDNTYSGATTISGGTLQLGDGGGTGMLGSGSVLVNAGALLAFNRDNTYVVNNAITGAGALAHIGTGTTILTGANTYTGDTTVTRGALRIGDGGTTGSIAGNIVNNANVSFDRSNALTYGNVISGMGTLTKTGAGTLTLTGDNTYSGATTISGGTLQLGNGGTTGSIAGNIINNANVSFDRSNALTYGNVISGTGTLAKTGAGTLTLTGANSYTGDTTVTGGALRIGNGGTTGSIAGNIVNNANVSFDRSNALTYGNVISGTGTLAKTGAGTLTLTGANSYTGDTTVTGGALRIGNGGTTGSIAGNIINNANVSFDRSNDLTYGNVISGTGTLTKTGAGTLTLTGNSSGFTGSSVIEAGQLLINGALGGSLGVASGATLGGTGIVGPTTVSGTLAPGASIGNLTVNGDLTFTKGSTYLVEISPTDANRTNVTGLATLRGTVQVVAAPGAYVPNTPYTILNAAGGSSGMFDNVTSNRAFTFLSPSLSYDSNNMFLTLVRNAVSFSGVGQTRNQRAVGPALDTLGSGPVFDTVALGSETQARQAFDQLSGEIHASAISVMLLESRFVREAITGRLRQTFSSETTPLTALAPTRALPIYASLATPPPDPVPGGDAALGNSAPVFAAWSESVGAWGRLDGDGNAAKVGRSTGGVFLGVDGTFDAKWRLGFAGGYTHGSLDVDRRRSSGSIDGYHLAAYSGLQLGGFAARVGASYTWQDVESRRSILLGSLFDRTKASREARTAQAFADVGYGIQLNRLAIEPFAAITYVNVDTDRFTESGDTAALSAFGGDSDSTVSTLGLRSATQFTLADKFGLTVRGSLGWRRAFGETTPTARLAFRDGGTPFTVAGAPIARNSTLLEAGLDFTVGRRVRVGLSYNGQIANNARDHAVIARLFFKF